MKVLFDLDGTLCNCEHRVHLAQAKQWEAFHEQIPNDVPRKAEELILRTLYYAGHIIVIVTGRFEQYRTVTEQWLAKHQIPYDFMRMRRDGDYRSDVLVKAEFITDMNDILCVFEDRDTVVAMWRDLGLTCFQVQPGAY